MNFYLTPLLTLVLCAGLPVAALAQAHNHSSATPQSSQEQTYICPMHPHIHGGPDDTCPICGMHLVPAKTTEPQQQPATLSAEERQGSTHINPALVQTIGVKTAPVQLEVFGDTLRAYGRVVPSTRDENTLSLRVEGWVEALNTSAIGDPVTKGDLLFRINSPQLISAQNDYFTARALGNSDIAKAAAQRLEQLGVSTKALAEMNKAKAALETVPFYAPASGIITELNVRNGAYVKAGTPVLTIQDLSTIWIEADVPEPALAQLKQDDRVTITLPQQGKKRLGKISYIQPTVNPATRTGSVRIELNNPDGALKPASFVDVSFSSDKRHRLAVPAEAVLRNGSGAYVLRWLGEGLFKPVSISTGVVSDTWVEVRSGLEQGQEVVTSGQFLLDAEANLKSGLTAITSHNHGQNDAEKNTEQPTSSHTSNEGNNHAGH